MSASLRVPRLANARQCPPMPTNAHQCPANAHQNARQCPANARPMPGQRGPNATSMQPQCRPQAGPRPAQGPTNAPPMPWHCRTNAPSDAPSDALSMPLQRPSNATRMMHEEAPHAGPNVLRAMHGDAALRANGHPVCERARENYKQAPPLLLAVLRTHDSSLKAHLLRSKVWKKPGQAFSKVNSEYSLAMRTLVGSRRCCDSGQGNGLMW